jgi:hypothetical protein
MGDSVRCTARVLEAERHVNTNDRMLMPGH